MPSHRALPAAGLAALAAGVGLVVLLMLVPPTSSISPVRRTISEYALTSSRWLFDAALLSVAGGSAAVLAAAARRGLCRPLGAATGLGAVWVACVLVMVVFQKTDWAVGPSVGGTVHRYASVVAFLALAGAVLAAARTAFPAAPGWRRAARALAAASLLGYAPIIAAIAVMASGGGPWWQTVPLGLIERWMSLAGIGAIAVLGAGALLPAPGSAGEARPVNAAEAPTGQPEQAA
jgi:hypothetical protein